MNQLSTYSQSNPWINRLSEDEIDSRELFYNVLREGLDGARLSDLGHTPNLYMAAGFSSQGYQDWDIVELALEKWCNLNDKRHKKEGNGWILLTHGDGDYGHKSVESIAQFVAARGTPVVFIQSHFGYCEPNTPYWPTYASAGLYGTGKFNWQDGISSKSWGGYLKNNKKGTVYSQYDDNKNIAFPDDALMNLTFNNHSLYDHLGGLFIAGGGNITREQAEIYRFLDGKRAGDHFVPANSINGEASQLNALYK
jgi:hypothetical protein